MTSLIDLLLSRKLVPDGPTHLTVNVHPDRVAYLLHPTDRQLAFAAISSAMFTLAGVHAFLIPCPPGGQPDPQWLEVLHLHDPDEIVDLVGADPEFLRLQDKRWGRHYHVWENPLATMFVPRATILGALSLWHRNRGAGPHLSTVKVIDLPSLPNGLQLAFRIGLLDKRPMSRELVVSLAYNALRVEDFIDVQQAAASDLSHSDVVSMLSSAPLDLRTSHLPLRSGISQRRSLPDLTHQTLQRREPAYKMYTGTPPSETGQFDEAYLGRIVVVSEPDSIADLCVAWNIRAQRASVMGFPLWISPEHLQDSEVIGNLQSARGWTQSGLSEPQGSQDLHFISTSIDEADLADLLPASLAGSAVHSLESVRPFFTVGLEVGPREEQVATFRRGVTDVRIPDYWLEADWDQHESIVSTVSIDGYSIPRGSVEVLGFPPAGNLAVRYSTNGQSGILKLPFDPAQRLMKVGIPNAWEIVEGLAQKAGYSVQISEKGRLAVAVMRLLGDDRGIAMLRSRPVYELIRAMAEIVTRQAIQRAAGRQLDRAVNIEAVVDAILDDVQSESQFDRQHWDRSRIYTKLGVEAGLCDQIISWLVERQIVFQGFVYPCPNCGVRRWYPIGRLQEVQTCDGCQVSSRRPISVEHLTWSYRLNELIGRAVDQGVLPHILAIYGLSGTYADQNPILAVYPGLLLEPSSTETTRIEIDLLAIYAGELIVGECKASAGSITQPEIDRFAALAKQLECSHVVYAIAADGLPDPTLVQHSQDESAPTHVRWWTSEDLFDRYPGRASLPAEEYLKHTLSRLADLDN